MGRGIIAKDINSQDVIETFIRSRGPGGQHINKVSSCVSLLHVPSGIRIKCQQSRSQQVNRRMAWALLRQKIQERVQHQQELVQQEQEKRRRQKRKRSPLSKALMLAAKKHHGQRKILRRKVEAHE